MLESIRLGRLRQLDSGKLVVRATERLSRDVEVTLPMADVLALADGMADTSSLAEVPGVADAIRVAIASEDVTVTKSGRTLRVWLVEPTN